MLSCLVLTATLGHVDIKDFPVVHLDSSLRLYSITQTGAVHELHETPALYYGLFIEADINGCLLCVQNEKCKCTSGDNLV